MIEKAARLSTLGAERRYDSSGKIFHKTYLTQVARVGQVGWQVNNHPTTTTGSVARQPREWLFFLLLFENKNEPRQNDAQWVGAGGSRSVLIAIMDKRESEISRFEF